MIIIGDILTEYIYIFLIKYKHITFMYAFATQLMMSQFSIMFSSALSPPRGRRHGTDADCRPSSYASRTGGIAYIVRPAPSPGTYAYPRTRNRVLADLTYPRDSLYGRCFHRGRTGMTAFLRRP